MMRLFDTFAGSSFGEVGAGVFPPINITQDSDNFYLRAEIPGIEPDQLAISAVRNRVSIAGKREIKREGERASYHRRERPDGTFDRAVTLPTEVEADRVEARYVDGVLTLTLPKAEEAKPRQIMVRT
jgi:HSP20 family protein